MDSENRTHGKHQKLGDLLVQTGVIGQKILEKALEIQKTVKKKIGQILIDMKATDDVQIAKALSIQLNIPYMDLSKETIYPEIIERIPQRLAEKYTLIPVKERKKQQLVVAMANPLELHAQDDLRFSTQMPLFITVAPRNDILSAIGKYYRKDIKPEIADVPVIENPLTCNFDSSKVLSCNHTILIVDDNPVVLEFLKRILMKNNFQVISASSGHEAFGIACKDKPDLVMADLMMPETSDGIALVNKLKSQPATRQIPVAILTSQSELDTQVEVLNCGANDYLIKPVPEKLLIAKINRLIADDAQESLFPAVIESQITVIPDSVIISTDSSETILLLDDNPVDIEIIKRILKKNNYQVISSSRGSEAIEVACQEKPDLIITDYLMPEMNGAAFISKLKSNKSTYYIPVIMLTSKDEPDALVEAFDCGTDHFLSKPVEEKVLMALIRKLLKPLISYEDGWDD